MNSNSKLTQNRMKSNLTQGCKDVSWSKRVRPTQKMVGRVSLLVGQSKVDVAGLKLWVKKNDKFNTLSIVVIF